MQEQYCGNCYDIYLIQSQYTKVAAFGRYHKRSGAASGRATSLVLSFGEAMNLVNVAAVNTVVGEIPCDGQKAKQLENNPFLTVTTPRERAASAF